MRYRWVNPYAVAGRSMPLTATALQRVAAFTAGPRDSVATHSLQLQHLPKKRLSQVQSVQQSARETAGIDSELNKQAPLPFRESIDTSLFGLTWVRDM